MRRRWINAGAAGLMLVLLASIHGWPLRALGHAGDRSRANRFEQALAQLRPRLIVLGNSMVEVGVDESLLAERTGVPCFCFARGGAASAWWYVAMKNAIVPAPEPPRLVALVFRDHYLTEPTFRVEGRYREQIDWFARGENPILDRLAFGLQGPRWLPINLVTGYERNVGLKQRTEVAVKDLSARLLFDLDREGLQQRIDRAFAEDRMDSRLLDERQLAAETADHEDAFDFHRQVDRSFLPHIIDVARSRGIELVLVRYKRRASAEVEAGLRTSPRSSALQRYIRDLRQYLDERGVALIDFSDEPRILLEHYGAGDHLNETGRRVFTELLAERLRPHLRR